ncbi:AMP-dependent synthetase/ligase [Streptomyces sp. NPDC056486]|uniref:AMP-dependent synthetase/ligase n=1 Tax=Streptomyces sp. NPDC056486 TaxID=3345835 RepID=UPI0036C05CB4
MQPTERPETLAVLTEWAAERHGKLPALRFKSGEGASGGGAWEEVSYEQLRDRVRDVGQELLALGVRPDDRVAILAETRPEWTYAHFAVFAAGAVVVPVYPTAGDEEVEWVIGDSDTSVVICENATQAAKIERLRPGLPGVRHVLLMTDRELGADGEEGTEHVQGAGGERRGGGGPRADGGQGGDGGQGAGGGPRADGVQGAGGEPRTDGELRTDGEPRAGGGQGGGGGQGAGGEACADGVQGGDCGPRTDGGQGGDGGQGAGGGPRADGGPRAGGGQGGGGEACADGVQGGDCGPRADGGPRGDRQQAAAREPHTDGEQGNGPYQRTGPDQPAGPVSPDALLARADARAPADQPDLLLARTGARAPADQPDALLARAGARTPADLATIIYTSGTTGLPKGCLLTHGNLGAVQSATLPLIQGGPGDSTYLYLPLAHLLAQLIEFTTLIEGGELCFFGGKIENVVAELAEARPTHLPSVPRLFEKVYSVVLSLAEAQDGGRERFEDAVRIGVLAADGVLPPELREAYEAADKALYGLVRQALGGRVRWALSGGAPIAPHVIDFLRACGIAVYEGYGMTESAGVISLNHPGAVRYGTVGRPVEGCEVRIADDGEVLARGEMVFPGYHADPASTRDALDGDGWLHTGDLGAVDADGYLSITGRKKDLIITSGGKNLTPSLSELAVQRSRFVSRAVMVGDKRPYPVALITLDAEEISGWAEREGEELTWSTLSRDPRVRALVQEAVDAANATVSRPAAIRDFAVLDEDFTVEGGLLTPSLKVRRRAVAERYAGVIEGLYEKGGLRATTLPQDATAP